VPITCRNKARFGSEYCRESCPVGWRGSSFVYARVESAADEPPADPRVVDVAVLDMYHGRPNLGHDSLVHAVADATCDLRSELEGMLSVRVVSYDVRRGHVLPEPPGGRFSVYLGTGGPGHLDPHRNDGVAEFSRGIREDASWETALFRLFDCILESEEAALLAVCYTFGVMCRWTGVAHPVQRSAAKGGKSTGVLENILTAEGACHPWFAALADQLPDGRRLRVMDSRLFDLIPSGRLRRSFVPIGYETRGVGGPPGDALTMMEFARDRDGIMPRVFGVNHHPEIVDRTRQALILEQKVARDEVTRAWYEERLRILRETYSDQTLDGRLHLTSDYTLLGPLRFHLHRQLRRRASALGLDMDIPEDRSAPGPGDHPGLPRDLGGGGQA
jgi:hypothetical protein